MRLRSTLTAAICCALLATGVLGSVAEGRELIRRTEKPVEYLPADRAAWEEFYQHFVTMRADVPTAF